MGLFNLFKKKKKDQESSPPQSNCEQEEYLGYEPPACEHCGKIIESWEKRTTFDKKKYHVGCFRKLKKQAGKLAFKS